MLKVDINRMRLGSYQRELPQDSLKKLVHETIADCVCSRGIDTHHAAVNELMFVPGIEESQAKQIAGLAAEGKLESRSQLCQAVTDWPEMQSRQALGWLRVFGSEQPLDATAIHPEDYRLAQRLIDNTEFESPPAQPASWIKQISPANSSPLESATPPEELAATQEASTEMAPSTEDQQTTSVEDQQSIAQESDDQAESPVPH